MDVKHRFDINCYYFDKILNKVLHIIIIFVIIKNMIKKKFNGKIHYANKGNSYDLQVFYTSANNKVLKKGIF